MFIFVTFCHNYKLLQMKKGLKIILIGLVSLVLLLIMAGFGGWLYLKSTFLDFEGAYAEKVEMKELTRDGYTFLDRNGNNELDIYEDDRKSLEERTEDLLTQMTLEEKIHLLKGSGMDSGSAWWTSRSAPSTTCGQV